MILLVGWVSRSIPVSGVFCDEHKACSSGYIAIVLIWKAARCLEAHDGLVTAVATIFIAGFTYTLWRATTALTAEARRQRGDIRQSEERQSRDTAYSPRVVQAGADAAAMSAVAAERAVELMAQNAEQELRAYLEVYAPEIVDYQFVLPFSIKNPSRLYHA
jgi:hypothetical protein